NGGGDLVAEVLPLPPAPQFPKGPYGQGPGPVNGPYGPIIGPIPSPGNGGGDLVAEVLPLPPAPQFPKGPYGQGPGPVNGPFTGPTPSPGNGPYGPGPVLEPIPNEPVSIQLSRPGIDAYIQLTCNEDAKWEVVNNDGAKIVGIEEVYCDEYTEDLF
uniref:Galectin n=1 Tax=Panagrellus redivivus TaxID=6233 RepID=A0A7E4ZQP1_PANRE